MLQQVILEWLKHALGIDFESLTSIEMKFSMHKSGMNYNIITAAMIKFIKEVASTC